MAEHPPLTGSNSESDVAHLARMFATWQLLSIACSVWLFYIARHLKAGIPRLVACLPLAVGLLNAAPLMLDRCRMPVLFVPQMTLLSIAAFKVAAFAIGRGPLALEHADWYNSLAQFTAVLSLPIIPTAALRTNQSAMVPAKASSALLPLPPPAAPTTVPEYLRAAAWQLAYSGMSVQVGLLLWLPDIVRHWFYTLCLVNTLQCVWDFYGLIAALSFGVEPARSFHMPWLSSTLAEYWARRWNMPVTHMLRVLVYDPLIEGRLVPHAARHTHIPTTSTTQPGMSAAGPKDISAPHIRSSNHLTKATAATNPVATSSDASSISSSGSALSFTSTNSSSSSCASPTFKACDNRGHSCSTNTFNILVHGSSHAYKTAEHPAAGRPSSTANQEETTQLHNSPASSDSLKSSAGRPSLMKRFIALQASFLVSGLWHTLIFYHSTGRLIPHWFCFFAIQAPALVAEAVMLKAAKKKAVQLPHALAVFLTNFALIGVGSPLFFAPVDWSGLSLAFFHNMAGTLAGSEWGIQCRA